MTVERRNSETFSLKGLIEEICLPIKSGLETWNWKNVSLRISIKEAFTWRYLVFSYDFGAYKENWSLSRVPQLLSTNRPISRSNSPSLVSKSERIAWASLMLCVIPLFNAFRRARSFLEKKEFFGSTLFNLYVTSASSSSRYEIHLFIDSNLAL